MIEEFAPRYTYFTNLTLILSSMNKVILLDPTKVNHLHDE